MDVTGQMYPTLYLVGIIFGQLTLTVRSTCENSFVYDEFRDNSYCLSTCSKIIS